MAEPKKYKIGGKWLIKNEAGEWVETTPPANPQRDYKEAMKPIPAPARERAETQPQGELDTSARIARAFRDFELPVPAGMSPGIDLIAGIGNLVQGKAPSLFNKVPAGTGETRSLLTGLGAAGGAAAAGSAGIASGPGALAAGAAGYTAGGSMGSLIGQYLESKFPNLFQRGYAPESNDVVTPTEVSGSNVISDVALNAAGDALTLGAGKALNLTSKAAREQLVEAMMTRKYRPNPKNPSKQFKPPLTQEEVDALNATPNVPTTTGQVLDENSAPNMLQNVIATERTSTAIKGQVDALGKETAKFREDIRFPGAKGGTTAPEIGERGLASAQAKKAAMGQAEVDAYTEVEKLGKGLKRVTKVPPPPPDPNAPMQYDSLTGKPITPGGSTKEETIFGPVKLTRTQATSETEGKMMDAMIAEINDPQLAASLKLTRSKLSALGDGEIRSYKAVREIEKSLNEMIFDRKLPESARQGLMEIRANVVADLEKNLDGAVKETAGFWDSKAGDAYRKAKALTVEKFDKFNADMQKIMAETAGENEKAPGKRGGTFDTFYKTLLDSPQEAKRLAEVGGYENARDEFVRRIFTDPRFVNAETKQIDGNKALAFLESENVKSISNELLNREQRQRLRYLLIRAKEMDPKMSKVGQLMVDMGAANTAINMPGAAASAVFRGNTSALLKGVSFLSFYLGADKFARNYLLNDQFARRVANAMGKNAKRPGGGLEVAKILGTLQGVKLLVKADNGKEFMYDSDSKTLEPVPSEAK